MCWRKERDSQTDTVPSRSFFRSGWPAALPIESLLQLILVPDYLNVCLISEVNAPKDKKAERFIEQQIGGYIVEKELGRGGFGAAYLARRIRDNQRVALRICNLMPFSDYNRIVSGKAHAR